MKFENGTLVVVDDDRDSRESIAALVAQAGLSTEVFASAEDFLAAPLPKRPACIVADVRMLGMSGLEMLEQLNQRGVRVPVILVTAHADTPTIVKGMKLGAMTALDKPCRESELWDAIAAALQEDSIRLVADRQLRELDMRMSQLTPDESEVLRLLVAGESNKSIARQLEIGLRTVESRRHSISTKLGANSLADLVRIVVATRPNWTQ
jgi:two-component system response regulator FixJ